MFNSEKIRFCMNPVTHLLEANNTQDSRYNQFMHRERTYILYNNESKVSYILNHCQDE